MGQRILEFMEASRREEVEGVLTRALRGDQTANYELPLRTKDGDALMLLVNATTRRNVAGEVTGVVGMAQDITAMKQRESEVSALHEELQGLLETANAPVFGVDCDMRVTLWNQKAVEVHTFSLLYRDCGGQTHPPASQ